MRTSTWTIYSLRDLHDRRCALLFTRDVQRVYFSPFLFLLFFFFYRRKKKRSAPGACRREYDTRPPCVSRYNSLAALRRSIINFHDRLTSTVRMTNDEYCISPSSFDGLALRNQREKKKKKKRKTATCVQVGKWFLEDVVLRSSLVTLSHGIR